MSLEPFTPQSLALHWRSVRPRFFDMQSYHKHFDSDSLVCMYLLLPSDFISQIVCIFSTNDAKCHIPALKSLPVFGKDYIQKTHYVNDVLLTSMRRDDVASMLILRHFGTKCPLGSFWPFRISQFSLEQYENRVLFKLGLCLCGLGEWRGAGCVGEGWGGVARYCTFHYRPRIDTTGRVCFTVSLVNYLLPMNMKLT